MIFSEGDPRDVGFHREKIRNISATLAHWVKEEKTPAICAFIARKGVIVLHEAYGVQNAVSGKPTLTTDAIFPLASLTKTLTAACVVSLMDDGLIDGFSKVSRIIPEFTGPNKEDVTIHHLLTHTSGIDDEVIRQFNDDLDDEPPVPDNQHTQIHYYLQKIYACPQERKPGRLMTYSNAGYELLAEIVRRLSGKNIADFASERLFDPLGMQSTSYIVPDNQVSRIVRRRNSDPNGAWLNDPEYPKIPYGQGGGYSTIYDMAVFAQMLLNKGTYNDMRIFSPRAVELMTQNQIPGMDASWRTQTINIGSWGYGWNVKGTKLDDEGRYRSPGAFSHSGTGGVYLFGDPEYDVIAALFLIDTENTLNSVAKPKSVFPNMVIGAIDK